MADHIVAPTPCMELKTQIVAIRPISLKNDKMDDVGTLSSKSFTDVTW